MLVKINFGPRVGQVQDLAPAAARLMLDDGRATLAFPDQFPIAAVPAPELVPPAPRGDDGPPKSARRGRHANN